MKGHPRRHHLYDRSFQKTAGTCSTHHRHIHVRREEELEDCMRQRWLFLLSSSCRASSRDHGARLERGTRIHCHAVNLVRVSLCRKTTEEKHIALASVAARRVAMFIKLKPLPKVAGSAAGAAATRCDVAPGISAIAAPQHTGTQMGQEFAVHTGGPQEDECGSVMCTSAGVAEAAEGRRTSAVTQNKSKQLQAAGMPVEEGGIPPLCLLTETPRKAVDGRVDVDHGGANDGQQKISPPPSGLWACKFRSTVRGGPHEESQEYHFHSDGRITGHITNSFSAYDIKGSWRSDGSFSYFQVGGDLVKFDGKVSGERVEGTFKSLRDSGRFSSVLVRARVERKNPKVVPRSSVRGILKTARSNSGSRRRPQARVSFPLPFVHEERI